MLKFSPIASSIVPVIALAGMLAVGACSNTDSRYADRADGGWSQESQANYNNRDERDDRSAREEARDERIEARIDGLHDKLGITGEQEGKWQRVAEIMRDNESQTHRLIRERHDNRQNMTAVDDFKSYEQIATLHARGLRRFIPAFEDLYNSMSEQQQKKADNVFRSYKGGWGHKGHKGKAPAKNSKQ